MATHPSILAWLSPRTEEPGGLQSMGLHDWACVHEGGGRWVGSNKVVELKKKEEETARGIKKEKHWELDFDFSSFQLKKKIMALELNFNGSKCDHLEN